MNKPSAFIPHFPKVGMDGLWHTCRRVPGTNELHSVASGPCEKTARQEAKRLNDEQRRAGRVEA